MKREELVKKAGELKLEIKDEMKDEEIEKLIEEKEDEGKDKNYYKLEAQKAFKDRDEAKKERNSLRDKIKEFEDKLKTAPNPEEVATIKKELEELRTLKKELEDKKLEDEMKNKTELERAEINFKRQFDSFKVQMEGELDKTKKSAEEIKKILEQKDTVISNLRKSRLRSEIMEAASKNDAFNPSQIVDMLQYKFEYDEGLDKFLSKSYDSKGKLSEEKKVDDIVKEFLENPINDNLVRSKLKLDGMGNKGRESGTTLTPPIRKSTPGTYDPKDPSIIMDAQMARLPVEDWIEVLKKRDAKMHPKKE
jgi:hypothetical protein